MATASGSRVMPCATRPDRLAVILVGGTPAPDAATLAQTRARVERAGFRLLPIDCGKNPGLGPLGGILAAVTACPDRDGCCLLVVPADMPLLNPRALQRLADIAEADGRGALFDLGPLPLALMLNAGLRQVLHQATEGMACRSLTGLAERLGLPIAASLPDDGLDNLVTRRGRQQTPTPDNTLHPAAAGESANSSTKPTTQAAEIIAIPDHQGESR